MLDGVIAPFRTGRSWRNIALMILVSLIPFVGSMWVMGWLLDHQRDVAWSRGDGSTPGMELTSERLIPGVWALIISTVWTMPLSMVLTFVGGALSISRLIGPTFTEMERVSATSSVDPIQMQQQMTLLITDSLMPALGLTIVLTYAGVVLMTPLIAAATLRYNLYRAPREGFRLSTTISTLRAGGTLTLKAAAVSFAVQVPSFVMVAVAWPQFVRSFALMAVSPFDPAAMGTALAGYLTFAVIANVGSLISVPLHVATYSAWGVWSRKVYRLSSPSPSPTV